MSSRKLFVILLAVAFMIGAVGSAHAATGSALVTQYGCLGCHNPIPTAATNAAMVTRLTNAINGGVMNGISKLKALTAADIQAIADYLVPAAPVACTGYTYSAWSACGSNGQQTRTVTGNTPAGCTGTPSIAAVLTQACTPTSSACTYTYSAWSPCQTNNRQTRTVVSSSPAGCTGTPLLTQVCNYVSPTPTPSPTINGTTLYMQRCSACHGSIERSQVRGVSASDIKEAITNVRKMSFLKSLTNAQIQAIANALVTTTPPPTPPVPSGGVHPSGWLKQHPDFADRNGTSSCKACHGSNLQGGIGPSCFSCHRNGD